MMFRLPFFALALLLLCLNLNAQIMPFKNYSVKDGLSNNNALAVIKDNRGLLWVGTDLGLDWFDGKRFYQPKIKSQVGQLYVSGFYKDQAGVIWILTFFNGIYKYQNNRFTNYLVDPLLKDAAANTVSDMVQMSPGKYVVVSGNASYLFDGKAFSIFDPGNVVLKTKTNGVTRAADGTIVLSTDAGIFFYRCKNGKPFPCGDALKGRPTIKTIETKDRFWVLTNKGILSFKNSGIASLSVSPVNYLVKKQVKDIAADKNGVLWAIIGNGSKWALGDTVLKIKGDKVIPYTNRNGLPQHIQQIYCDDDGLVWFANSAGIDMLGDEYYEFNTLVSGGYNNPVSSLVIDSRDNLWAGTTNGLALKRGNRYIFFRNNGGRPIGYVAWFNKTKDGELLAGTIAGVLELTPHSIKKKFDIKSSAMCIDNDGNEWFGDINGFVWRFDGKSLMSFKIDHPISEMISAMYAGNGCLWLGYRDHGLVKYKCTNGRLLRLKDYSAATGYPDMRIRCCTADAGGNIIWGTRTNGVFIFSTRDDRQIAHINTQNGLNANWIKFLHLDTGGKLYLATNNGVNIVTGDYKKPMVKYVKINDDNINRETNCVLKVGDSFYVGTNDGVLKWMPSNSRKDTVPPPVYFTKITIQGLKSFSVDPYTANAGEVSLQYDQHFISFEFAGISLKNPDNVLYHYILTGQDNEWSPLTKNNDVAYNLKPGTYTFKVAAKNTDGVWSRSPAVFRFIIKPPFWQAWWFILLVAAIVLYAAYSVYQYKLSKMLALELLRNKISTDLHDDIGSTLSSISILSAVALNEKEQKSRRVLGEINERSHLLMEKMDDIVWSISSKNDTVGNLFSRIQQFAAGVLEAKDIEYEVHIPEKVKEVKLNMQQRQHIYLLLKEAINNLIKYSACTSVSITAELSGRMLKIEVVDNGRGFDEKGIAPGNGLLNMQKRAEAMRGNFSITTAPGKGTRVNLSVEIE